MPRSLIQVPFAGGLDERTDARHVLPGKLLTLVNGVFSKTGAIHKRRGYTMLGSSVLTGGSISAATRLGALGDDLVLSDGNKLYSYVTSTTKWAYKDQVSQLAVRREPVTQVQPSFIGSDASTLYSPDVAYASGYRVHVWSQDRSPSTNLATVYASVVNHATAGQARSAQAISTSQAAECARVVTIGNTAYAVWIEAGIIKCRTLDLTNPAAWTAAVNLATDALATNGAYFDACASATTLYVAYVGAGGTVIRLRSFDSSLAAVASVVPTVTPAALFGIGLQATDGERVWLAYEGAVGGNDNVYVQVRNTTTLASTGAEFLVSSEASTADVGRVAVARLSSTVCVVTWSRAPSGVFEANHCQVSASPSAVTPVRKLYRHVWASVPFMQSSRMYALAYYCNSSTGTQQPTCFVVDLEVGNLLASTVIPRPVVTIAPRRAPFDSVFNGTGFPALLSNVVATSTDSVGSVMVRRSATGRAGLDAAIITAAKLITAELGGALHLSGGVPCTYDRARVVESAPLLWPEQPTVTQTTATGSIANGTYGYALVWAKYDSASQVSRSAPTLFTVVVNGATPTQNRVNMVVPQLPITLLQDSDSGFIPRWVLEVYRTLAGGTVYFKVPDSQIAGSVLNDPSLSTQTVQDVCADASLSGQPFIYTTGGVLENRCPPSANILIAHGDRIILAGTDDPKVIWTSKVQELGEAPAYHESLTITVEDGGDVTALASLDGNLIVFKWDRIFVVPGQGPNKGGAGAWGIPQRIASDVGSLTPYVAVTPEGIVFRSAAGLYLLNRSLGVQYIGGPVEDTLASFPILTSIRVHEEDFEVRFSCNDVAGTYGVVLVWNYLAKEWSVFKLRDYVGGVASSAIADAVLWGGEYTWVSPLGSAYDESYEAWLDVASWVELQATTPWFKLGGLQGYQRVFDVQLLLERLTSHDLKLEIAFDYVESWVDVKTWTASRIDAMDTEFLERGIKRPKSTAIKFRITDATPSDGPAVGTGRGPALLGLLLEVNALPKRRLLTKNQRA